jgi:hypothetical protein
MTAAAVLSGKEIPKMFGLARLKDATKSKTQFDT